MRPLILTVLLALPLLTAACATPARKLPVAIPRTDIPADAARACALYLLPASPTQADLEIGFATRGAQILDCDGRRAQAVAAHQLEHDIQDQAAAARAERARPWWKIWP